MFSRRLKTGYFVLEGLNSFALVYYLYYLYFFTRTSFGFDNKTNLELAALSGGVYALFAWWGGKFAQRFGYFPALKVGFVIMIGALSTGLWTQAAAGQVLVMVGVVIGMCFTWPSLEALVSEGERDDGVQDMVGIYNVVWAATAALANFTGGAMLEWLGPRSLFYVPLAIQMVQLGLTLWLEGQARPSAQGQSALGAVRVTANPAPATSVAVRSRSSAAEFRAPAESADILATGQVEYGQDGTVAVAPSWQSGAPIQAARARSFVRMAWLANPFAYIAINTVVAVIPGVAERLKLSTMLAGFCCSVWCFARLGAFLGLWLWSGWHYRFRWLLLAYLGLVGAFAAILLAPSLAFLVLAQMLFGGAVGLIYYSSLFYSMDRSETKGEHGGIHEAVIGLGNFAGPAVGAAALQFLPRYGNSGVLAVTVLLLCGLGGLTALYRMGQTPRQT